MKEDEDIETMLYRFQILVYGLQVLNKSYTISDHVKKILRILPVTYRPKVTTIQEAKDLNTLSIESIIRNIQSHEMELNGDDPSKKLKSLVLKSYTKSTKAHKIWNSKEASQSEGSEGDLDNRKLAFIIKRFQYLAKKNKILSGISMWLQRIKFKR